MLVIPPCAYVISHDAHTFKGRVKRLSLFVGFGKDIEYLQDFLGHKWNKKLLSLMMTTLPVFDGLRLIIVFLAVVYSVLVFQVSIIAGSKGIEVSEMYLTPVSTPLPSEFALLTVVLMALLALIVFVGATKGSILRELEEIHFEIKKYKDNKGA